MKNFFKRYRHAVVLLYVLLYIPWFGWLQSRDVPYTLMHCRLDDWIPFCEYFIIPYLLWFLYVGAAGAYFFFKSPKEFIQLCTFLFVGMTICLLIYTFLPNGQALRPDPQRDNLFIRTIQILWGLDPSINVCPSIHTYNSIGVHIALWRSPSMQKYPVIRYGSLILCILIILSTVFLKQHSVIDVAAAMILSIPMYILAYRKNNKALEEQLVA